MAGVYSSGVRFAAGGAAGVYFNGVRFARPIGKIAIAMDYAHLGLSSDIYTAASPTWTNLRTLTPALDAVITAGANFCNVALSKTGECWIITYGTAATNGLWYCSDITVAAPAFSLICSHTTAIALGGGVLHSLGCSDLGVAYCSPSAYTAVYLWGKTFLSAATGAEPVGVHQHSICSGASVRLGTGAGGVPAMGIRTLVNAVSAWIMRVQPHQLSCIPAVGFLIWPTVGGLYSYVDGINAITSVYGGVSDKFLAVDGGNAVTARGSDDMLMIGATPLATALTAFGAARVFGGCCIGASGYGELLVCARNPSATNFFAMRSTGGVWTVKDGDWVAKTGAWVGIGHSLPMIVTANLGGGTGVYFNAVRMVNG